MTDRCSHTRARAPHTPLWVPKDPRAGVCACDMDTPNAGKIIFSVDLRAEGQGPPVEIRLRRFLKCALRSFGLRAVEVRQTQPQTPDVPQDASEDH
jgi:hypothetical protein